MLSFGAWSQITKTATFQHGVASGDPTKDQVVIWTRINGDSLSNCYPVKWQVSQSSDFNSLVQDGFSFTGPFRDHTVKVDVSGLDSGQSYFYRFIYKGDTSRVGITKTIALDPKSVKFAVVSCNNYEWGYFNAYEVLAHETNIDAVLHLGDYIYEYGPKVYGDKQLDRVHEPDHEIISLEDYRTRYAQYRLDTNLQNAHAQHAFINIWDDHEITNNSFTEGAKNHQEDEGDYIQRRENARKAFYEWLPVRETSTLYRSFQYGQLVNLIMLDERLAGRSAPAQDINDPLRQAPDHKLLGDHQWAWLENQMDKNHAHWTIVGNQVIYSYLDWGYRKLNLNMDSWDGFPSDQERMAKAIEQNKKTNVVFVTGDTHSSWAINATHQPFKNYNITTGQGAYAVEFGTPSISSSNSNEKFTDQEVIDHEKKIVKSEINPHLQYANLRDHGYLLMEVNSKEAIATFKYIETVRTPKLDTKAPIIFTVKSGSNQLYREN